MPVDTEFLERRRTSLQRATETWLREIRDDEGRERLSPVEQRKFNDAQAELRDIDAQLERTGQANASVARLQARIAGHQTTPSTSTRKTTVNDNHLTYRQHDRRTSWVRDLVLHQTGMDDSGESRRRLASHAREVAEDPAYMEHRDLSRIDGQGGYATPPAWLMDEYVELARPGRAFANLCSRRNLPAGTDSINIPKVLTGTAVGVQTADNTLVAEQDLSDTYINAPVRTIAGQQGVSIQLLDQSPIAFDDVIFRDLVAAHAAVTDAQVIGGTGASGQILGVSNTPGITTIAASTADVPGIYKAIANGIQIMHTTRFQPPEVCVMHPRRWGWLLSQLDDQHRPLFIPNSQAPMNAAGIETAVASQQVVGMVQGLPVVTDPNLPVTLGAESPTGTEDPVYVLRASDLLLWESGLRARVLPETRAPNLTVLLQVYSYVAFSAARYPQSVVEITGLPAPVW